MKHQRLIKIQHFHKFIQLTVIIVFPRQEENDSLKCQLEAYKNEIDIMRSENVNEMDSKTQNIHQLKSRIGVLENQLAQAKKHQVAESVKLRIMEAKARTAKADKKDGEFKDDKPDKDSIINLTLETAEKVIFFYFTTKNILKDSPAIHSYTSSFQAKKCEKIIISNSNFLAHG